MITFNELVTGITENLTATSRIIITEAVIDSRKAIPGSLFVALPGERTNGHRFIQAAFEKGAHIALIQEDVADCMQTLDLRNVKPGKIVDAPEPPFCIRVDDSLQALQNIARYWRHQLELKVIGITGSVGKSSTKELIAEVLNQRFHVFKNPGNYNNEIGLPLTILNLGEGYEIMVAEMGFYYPGEIRFLCEIAKPDIGILTNIGTVHAERAGTQETIANGKAELLESLPTAPQGIAILNYDDPLVREMATKTKAGIIFYGLNPEADLWADEIQSKGLKGIQFRLHYQGKSNKLQIPMLGRHSVQTVLRASAAAFSLGMTWEEIIEGLIHSSTQLRLVTVQTPNGALILDDTYNATPESTIAALDLLSEIKGYKIAVLGDMLELGSYEQSGHEQVGQRAAEVVNYLITIGTRGEIIAETAIKHGLPPTATTCLKDALEAANLLKYKLRDDCIVLIKGSHSLEMNRISAILEESA